MENTEKKSYSNTVFLPKTSFSMKANLVNKEPEIIKFWNEKNIYAHAQSSAITILLYLQRITSLYIYTGRQKNNQSKFVNAK